MLWCTVVSGLYSQSHVKQCSPLSVSTSAALWQLRAPLLAVNRTFVFPTTNTTLACHCWSVNTMVFSVFWLNFVIGILPGSRSLFICKQQPHFPAERLGCCLLLLLYSKRKMWLPYCPSLSCLPEIIPHLQYLSLLVHAKSHNPDQEEEWNKTGLPLPISWNDTKVSVEIAQIINVQCCVDRPPQFPVERKELIWTLQETST